MVFQEGILYVTALRDPDNRRTLRSYDQCRPFGTSTETFIDKMVSVERTLQIRLLALLAA
jgi:hypothetical protein